MPVRTAIAQLADPSAATPVVSHNGSPSYDDPPPFIDPNPVGDPSYQPVRDRPSMLPVARRRNAGSTHAAHAQVPASDPSSTATASWSPTKPVRHQRRPSIDGPILQVIGSALERVMWFIRDIGVGTTFRRIGLVSSGLISVWVVLFILTSVIPSFSTSGWTQQGATSTGSNAAAVRPTQNANDNRKPKRLNVFAASTDVKGLPIVDGIPTDMMTLYAGAGRTCGISWSILAAIGHVETNHGQSTSAGVNSGSNFAGAQGPMQFMPSTWAAYGIDASGDGKADVYNNADAVYSAAAYLCANGGGSESGVRDALWNYNHSSDYVALVQTTAREYEAAAYTTPIAHDRIEKGTLPSEHIGVPAVDIPVDENTPAVAVHKGRVKVVNRADCRNGVELAATDGVTYIYCNGSTIDVSDGASVAAGDVLLHSGPGSTDAAFAEPESPHLHFGIRNANGDVCTLPALDAWIDGEYVDTTLLNEDSCTGSE